MLVHTMRMEEPRPWYATRDVCPFLSAPESKREGLTYARPFAALRSARLLQRDGGTLPPHSVVALCNVGWPEFCFS